MWHECHEPRMREGRVQSTTKTGMGNRARLISAEELAEQLQIPVTTLYQWRHRGVGPRSMRLGRFLRFDQRDVDRWLEAQKSP